jgi:hypothetical protein
VAAQLDVEPRQPGGEHVAEDRLDLVGERREDVARGAAEALDRRCPWTAASDSDRAT